MKSDLRRLPTFWRPWLLQGVCLLLFLLCTAPLNAFARELSVALSPAATSEGYTHIPLVTARTSAFKKEPTVSGGGVIRGTLALQRADANRVSFLWGANGTLWLDLNNNGDLTDDPQGQVKASNHYWSSGYAYGTFTNISLTAEPLKSSDSPVRMDITLHDIRSRLSASGQARSYLSGKLELDGKAWEVGLTQPGYGNKLLLIRAWDQKDHPFNDSKQTDTFELEKAVHFSGQAFEVRVESEGSSSKRLVFVEIDPPLGDVHIAGSGISRMVLKGNRFTAILDSPGKDAKVPVDNYGGPQVRLGAGTNTAYREFGSATRRTISVASGKTTELPYGGPLTNSASIAQRGNRIDLGYKLIGYNAETYTLERRSRAVPPSFAVYEGNRKVASGKFEFG